jgi:predicted PurR-regulated permease PerM
MPESRPTGDLTLRLLTIATVAGVAYLFYETLSPFFSAIAWAAVLAYALYPVHRWLVRATRGRQTLSAACLCIAVLVGLILPTLYLALMIGEELAKTYRGLVELIEQGQGVMMGEGWRNYPLIAEAVERLREYQRLSGTNFRGLLAQNLTALGSWIVHQLTQVAANFLLGLLQLALVMIAAFYFFKDGERFVQWVQDTLPFSSDRQRIVIDRFDEVMTGAIYGNTAIAVLEGLVGGIAFSLAGLASPILWGSLMGLSAYIPLIGASVIWIPGVIYLFSQGAYMKMAIVISGGLIILYLDYIFRSVLVGDQSRLHPLLVLFGVLGGIKLFGVIGLVAGPLVIAMGRAVLEIYRLEKRAAFPPVQS